MPKGAPTDHLPAEVGAADLARLLGIGPRRVRELAEMRILPRTSRGRYPFEAAVTAYCAHLREVAAGRAAEIRDPDGGEVLDLATERARLAKAQREHVELKMARERDELVDAEAVRLRYAAMVRAAVSRLRGVPSRARGRLPSLTVDGVEELERLIDEALVEVADGADDEAAAA
jgi:phage terminase Nu1 subunit (DNA packaging protein)